MSFLIRTAWVSSSPESAIVVSLPGSSDWREGISSSDSSWAWIGCVRRVVGAERRKCQIGSGSVTIRYSTGMVLKRS